jgi:hypothetical protein
MAELKLETIGRMFRSGKTRRQIAEELKVSHQYVSQTIRKLQNRSVLLAKYPPEATELAEAALKLCEWVPNCSKGSSGDLRKQKVLELATKILGRG